MYCVFYKLILIIYIGVTGMFGYVVGNRRFEVLLPGHRTHDIYGSRKTDQRLYRHQEPTSSVKKGPSKYVLARWYVYILIMLH